MEDRDALLVYHINVLASSRLICDREPGETSDDLLEWMWERQSQPGHYMNWTHERPVPEGGALTMSFENKDDAFYFKLTWGGK